MSKYGVFSGPYFTKFGQNTERYSVFSPNAGKYGQEKTPYMDTFHTVKDIILGFSKEVKFENVFNWRRAYCDVCKKNNETITLKNLFSLI